MNATKTMAADTGLRELDDLEIDLVSGGDDAKNVCRAAGVGSIVVGAAGVGLAFSAAGPVGFAVGFGLGMGGIFLGSAGLATCEV